MGLGIRPDFSDTLKGWRKTPLQSHSVSERLANKLSKYCIMVRHNARVPLNKTRQGYVYSDRYPQQGGLLFRDVIKAKRSRARAGDPSLPKRGMLAYSGIGKTF